MVQSDSKICEKPCGAVKPEVADMSKKKTIGVDIFFLRFILQIIISCARR